MNLISLLVHGRQIEATIEDAKTAIQDLIAKHPSKAEFFKVLDDIVGLITSGVISIPGVDAAAVKAAIDAFKSGGAQ